ncbi:Endonuclease V [Clonorchis sinensis]|uniref:Endonuclease V n=1 Tax=Clonorchis sinensis TaxID=79923 RepID=A0A3R7CWC1_CLOSI|nr:Endonuclease V [Clonorchis sinensis]
MDVSLASLQKQWAAEQLNYRRELVLRDPEWLASRLVAADLLIGGLDISFSKYRSDVAVVTLAVVHLESLKLVTQSSIHVKLTVPYLPTFLGYREIDPYIRVVRDLKETMPQSMPDILMVDGNGTLHPRGFGSACQVGYQLDLPTLGVAKNLLEVSSTDSPSELDNWSSHRKVLMESAMLNSTGSMKPVFISPGHRISLDTACTLVLKTSKFRTPEPIRLADQISRKEIRLLDSASFDS